MMKSYDWLSLRIDPQYISLNNQLIILFGWPILHKHRCIINAPSVFDVTISNEEAAKRLGKQKFNFVIFYL